MLSTEEWSALKVSLIVASESVLLSLPVAIAIAFVLVRARFAGKPFLDIVVHLPIVLPPVVVGYLLLLVLGAHGVIGHWLAANFGIHLAFTTGGAALATAVMSFPLTVRAIRLSLEGIHPGLEEAARTLCA